MEKELVISPQYGWEEFKRLLIEEAQEGIFLIREICKRIHTYPIEGNMYDSVIQESTRSMPIKEDILGTILYVLIFEPELGKRIMDYELCKNNTYIFHFNKKHGGTFTRLIIHDSNGWCFSDLEFDRNLWRKNTKITFLFFNEERVI